MYSYSGALFNVYMKWIENDMKESVDEMAEIFCKKYNFERIYAGAIFKEEAKKLGLSVKELSLGQEHFDIDPSRRKQY